MRGNYHQKILLLHHYILSTTTNFISNRSLLNSSTFGEEDGGDINITADSAFLTNGSYLITSNNGRGNAGAINIQAIDNITFDESYGFSQVTEGSEGNAGGININTNNLFLNNGAFLNSSTYGNGNAGTIIINATGTVSLEGVSDDLADIPGNFGFVSVSIQTVSFNESDNVNFIPTAIFSQVGELSSGTAGRIEITANTLSVSKNGQINTRSFGQGSGGSININADSIALDNQGIITAETSFGEGGNIILQIDDNLTLRNNSTISAQALKDANGGNIDIDAEFIIGFPNQNNDIFARAEQGNGGNINISTNAIFGAEFFNISASSQFGLEGEISITTPEINPLQGLDNLPTEVVDATQLIAERCLAGDGETAEQQSEFTITGRGGLPSNPNESLRGEAVVSPEWVNLDSQRLTEQRNGKTGKHKGIIPPPMKIVQATGWVMGADGKVILTADNPNALPSPVLNPPHCRGATK